MLFMLMDYILLVIKTLICLFRLIWLENLKDEEECHEIIMLNLHQVSIKDLFQEALILYLCNFKIFSNLKGIREIFLLYIILCLWNFQVIGMDVYLLSFRKKLNQRTIYQICGWECIFQIVLVLCIMVSF